MDEEIKSQLKLTEVGDDVNMLVCMIRQLMDGNKDASVQIPNSTIHCKYWDEIGASDLAKAMEEKYFLSARIDIPEKFLTSF